MRRQRHLQPLAEDDLEDVAGADVFDALPHRLPRTAAWVKFDV